MRSPTRLWFVTSFFLDYDAALTFAARTRSIYIIFTLCTATALPSRSTLQFLILLVGYFVLGPSDLYKLVKEIGKFIQNIRTLGTDLSTTLENNMESSLQLDELRKAQRELNDAFSFRRSINVDEDSEAFSVQAGSAQQAEQAAAATGGGVAAVAADATGTSPTKTKKIRRRVRRKPTEEEAGAAAPASISSPIPNLEMPVTAEASSTSSSSSSLQHEADEDALAKIDEEFEKYVNPAPTTKEDDGKDDRGVQQPATAAGASASTASEDDTAAAQSRFQQQLSGNWNDQVLAAGEKLEPMAVVMNKIALLEREKQAAITRLEEEFAKRTELEEKYYQEQRQLLEETAAQVQNAAFGLEDAADAASKKKKTKV